MESLHIRRSLPALLAAVFLALFLGAYISSLKVLAVAWSGVESAGYSHGFLVLLCSAYLLYLKKDAFAAQVPRPNWWAALPLAGASLLWFAAKLTGVQALQLALLPVLLISAVWLVLGNAYLKLSFMPLFILFFAIPMWQPALGTLQDITTAVTHVNLDLIGRPVFVEGNYVHLVGGTFLIDESCAGLRFLLVSSILSLMNSDMHGHDLKRGGALLAIILVLSLIANWIRVAAVVLIGDYTNMQHPLVHDHLNFGWAVYLVVTLVPYFLVSLKLDARFGRRAAPSRQHSPPTGPKVLHADFPWALPPALLLLASGPFLESFYSREERVQTMEVSIPLAAAPWRVEPDARLARSDWRPDFQGGDETVYARYTNQQDQAVELHIVYYDVQRQDAELINVNNRLADEKRWFMVLDSVEGVSLDLKTGPDSVLSLEMEAAGQARKKVWFWYNVGGEYTVNAYLAKWLQVKARLRGRDDGGLFALAIDCGTLCQDSEAALEKFMRDMGIPLTQSIQPAAWQHPKVSVGQ